MSGIGPYCHPAAAHGLPAPRRWLLCFEDAARSWSLYDDEAEARAAFDRAEAMGWNCHLFESAAREPDATIVGNLTNERDRYRGQWLSAKAYNESAVWYWQGDGGDALESLTCPVIIKAEAMRRLVRVGECAVLLAHVLPTASPMNAYFAAEPLANLRQAIDDAAQHEGA